MGNRNLYIEEEQTTQWPKEEVQKDKQQSTTKADLFEGTISPKYICMVTIRSSVAYIFTFCVFCATTNNFRFSFVVSSFEGL
jgi:hypothetical protein